MPDLARAACGFFEATRENAPEFLKNHKFAIGLASLAILGTLLTNYWIFTPIPLLPENHEEGGDIVLKMFYTVAQNSIAAAQWGIIGIAIDWMINKLNEILTKIAKFMMKLDQLITNLARISKHLGVPNDIESRPADGTNVANYQTFS